VKRLTLSARSDAYATAFPDRPRLQVVREGVGSDRHDVLYGLWLIGNDYRNRTRYFGAYPAGYLDRVMALFPDICEWRSRQRHTVRRGRVVVSGNYPLASATPLHVFSGSLPASSDYTRVDINPDVAPDIACSVYDLPQWFGAEACRKRLLVIADPPYSAVDAERYGTPMVDRRRAMAALAEITAAGGHLVWLDTVWPMHRKTQWRTVGRIGLVRSTNHRVRMVSIFERRAA